MDDSLVEAYPHSHEFRRPPSGAPGWTAPQGATRRPASGAGPRALSGTVHGKWPGVSAQAWLREADLDRRPALTFGRARRIVVVTAHDDDLVGVGATLARAARTDIPVRLITATATGSHGGGVARVPRAVDPWAPERRRARLQAVAELGLPWPKYQSLGIPVGHLAERERSLGQRLRQLLRPGDLVLTTWWSDGNADHEATGRAVCQAAATHDIAVHGAAVWLWHWARPTNPVVPWSKVTVVWPTAQEQELKQAAMRTLRGALAGQDMPGPDDRILDPVRRRRAFALPEMFIAAGTR